MSSRCTDVEVEIPILRVRWRVGMWEKSSFYSSSFKFQGREWCLEYCYFYSTSHHKLRLRLQIKSDGSFMPFDLSLNVESNSTGRIIPELTTKRRMDCHTNNLWICTIPEADFLRLDPQYRRTHYINFLVVLKDSNVPLTDTDSKESQTDCNSPEDIDSNSKAIQTVCNPPEGINVSCRSVLPTLLPSTTLCLESLSEDLAKLMVQDSDLDVEFQCGDQSTKAHSAVVSARSPVIASMLASNMIEGRTKVVKIPNMEPEIFQQFLRYLYSGKLDELTVDTAISLYGTGQQYAVHALAKRCSDFLIDHLSVENACEVLFVADAHSDADFAKAGIEFLVEHKVPASGGSWLDFCDQHPKLASVVLTHYCQRLPK